MSWHKTINVKTMELFETDRHLRMHVYATDRDSFDFLVFGTLSCCLFEDPTKAAMRLQQLSMQRLQLVYCRADVLIRVRNRTLLRLYSGTATRRT